MRANSSGIFNRVVRLLNIAAMLCIATTVHSQRTVPDPYPEETPVNYVRTWDATAPDPDGNYLTTRPLKDVKMATQYIDGLGRPMQTVVKQGSLATGGSAKDMVSMTEYDEHGRQRFTYLPYAATGAVDGAFKTDPFDAQAGFMNSTYYSSQGETWYYSQTDFEASPLNRPVKSMAPGNNWVGAARGVAAKYWHNTSADVVKKWTVTTTASQLPTCSTGAGSGYNYPAGELTKSISIDEHGKQVILFHDKSGNMLLKKVQLTATADDGSGDDYDGWLCTYYIYDIYNNLRCVVQPEGVQLLEANSWNMAALGGDIVDEQCFQYGYDDRNRMTVKKMPGAGEIRMVYDKYDRLVMTQDAKMRAGQKWLYMTYDALNRPEATGLMTDPTYYDNLSYHIAAAAGAGGSYPNLGSYTTEELARTFYNNYSWLSTYSNPLPSTYNTAYDTYLQPASTSTWPYPVANSQSTAVKGMATGSRTKILGTGNYLYNVIFYDAKGRVIQTQGTNITGGTDIVTIQYTWAGQPLVNVLKQQNSNGSGATAVVVTKNTYDALGRPVLVEKKQSYPGVNGGNMTGYATISQLEYDELGQLKNKVLGNISTPVETLSYDYNIRGWMLGMNRDYARDENEDHYFGFDLGYDKMTNNLVGSQAYNAPQYNGNIAGTVWKSKGDGEKRKYDFGYDAANRLLRADFTQYSGSVFDQADGVNYNVKMGDGYNTGTAYDANGNIKTMQQWGLKLNSSSSIDYLNYQYIANSNKLLSVTENSLGTTDNKLGDFTDKNTSNDDYSYDVNGNLTLDKNKAISSITYNHLNLPSVITVTGKGSIGYIYDAGGNKLRKVTTEANVTITHAGTTYNNITVTGTTDYIGSIIYESKSYSNGTLNTALGFSDKLQVAGHEEGRIRALYDNNLAPNTITDFAYDYMIKDHLGNVRMVLTEEVKQVTYPAATLEDATVNGSTAVARESEFYTIDATKIVANPAGSDTYPNNNGNPPYNNNYHSNTGATTSKVYKTNASANKIGLGIVLKVMAGDAINIYGKSYHKKPTGANYTNPVSLLSLADVIGSFTGTGLMIDKGITGTTITGAPGFPASIPALLGTQPGQTNDLPRASVNWIVFDEQFKYQDGGFDMADGTSGSVKSHTITTIPTIEIPKNGYIYVYVSNESNYDVFFDNLQLIHTPGPILEETHYYPFGLTMAGISSKAYGSIEKAFGFNSILQNEDFELNMYDAYFRNFDPQISRWWQIDPKAEILEDFTPYNCMGNNPILFNDPLGDLLKVNFEGNEELKNQFLGFINRGLNDFHTASINSDGYLELKDNKKEGAMTESENTLYQLISKVADPSSKEISINLTNDGDFSVDSYESASIDMKQVSVYDDGKFLLSKPEELIAHFLTEQQLRQLRGKDDYPSDHQEAKNIGARMMNGRKAVDGAPREENGEINIVGEGASSHYCFTGTKLVDYTLPDYPNGKGVLKLEIKNDRVKKVTQTILTGNPAIDFRIGPTIQLPKKN